LFDLADMQKTRSSIPIAFAAARHSDPAGQVRRQMRQYLTRQRVLRHDLELLLELLDPHLETDRGDVLLDDGEHPVAAGKNFAP
jgi:hypothetical protein